MNLNDIMQYIDNSESLSYVKDDNYNIFTIFVGYTATQDEEGNSIFIPINDREDEWALMLNEQVDDYTIETRWGNRDEMENEID